MCSSPTNKFKLSFLKFSIKIFFLIFNSVSYLVGSSSKIHFFLSCSPKGFLDKNPITFDFIFQPDVKFVFN